MHDLDRDPELVGVQMTMTEKRSFRWPPAYELYRLHLPRKSQYLTSYCPIAFSHAVRMISYRELGAQQRERQPLRNERNFCRTYPQPWAPVIQATRVTRSTHFRKVLWA